MTIVSSHSDETVTEPMQPRKILLKILKVFSLCTISILVGILIGLVIASKNNSSRKVESSDTILTNGTPKSNHPVASPTVITKTPLSSPGTSSPSSLIIYSPPQGYDVQACNHIGKRTEICIAAECLSSPNCKCEMYTRVINSNSIIGFCNSCYVCDGDGNLAFDCSNLSSTLQVCPPQESESEAEIAEQDGESLQTSLDLLPYSPLVNKIDAVCVPMFLDETLELCYAESCSTNDICLCNIYTKDIFSGRIMGVCESCSVCGDGNFAANCSNVGYIVMECKDDSEEAVSEETLTEDQETTQTDSFFITELVQHKPLDDSTSSTLTTTSGPTVSYSSEDYVCLASSKNIETCYAEACTEIGCTCDAYFRDILTKEPFGSCSTCTICANDSDNPVGLKCIITGIQLNLPCS